MWFDDIDVGGRGVVRPAVGPLGRALRQTRLDLLLSQDALARAAGIHQTVVSRVEFGAPNWRLFCRLVDLMGGEPIVTVRRYRGLSDELRAASTAPYGWLD